MARPLKVLYVRNEDSAGTLSIFAAGHRRLGTEVRVLTLFRTAEGFQEDICLNLPLLPSSRERRKFKERWLTPPSAYKDAEGYPPIWSPPLLKKRLFALRDWLWRPYVEKAIREYELDNFDIYHLEGGSGIFRTNPYPFDRLAAKGKHLLANYHGVDMRTRGVLPWIDQLTEVNTTSEVDLLEKHPNIEYVYLPYPVDQHQPCFDLHSPLRLCHATRDRYWKGSDQIIQACQALERSHDVEFVLIENRSHAETLRIKAECDIYIDQVANLGGWGYGMNSVEAMALGLACCTNLLPAYETFLGDHPFYQVSAETLYTDLRGLVENPGKIMDLKQASHRWVRKRHDTMAVMHQVYGIYKRQGWIEELPDGLR